MIDNARTRGDAVGVVVICYLVLTRFYMYYPRTRGRMVMRLVFAFAIAFALLLFFGEDEVVPGREEVQFGIFGR